VNVLSWGLVLAVLPASGEIKIARRTAPVTVYTQFERTPTEGVLAAIQDVGA
jgi:hypothetical protein